MAVWLILPTAATPLCAQACTSRIVRQTPPHTHRTPVPANYGIYEYLSGAYREKPHNE